MRKMQPKTIQSKLCFNAPNNLVILYESQRKFDWYSVPVKLNCDGSVGIDCVGNGCVGLC